MKGMGRRTTSSRALVEGTNQEEKVQDPLSVQVDSEEIEMNRPLKRQVLGRSDPNAVVSKEPKKLKRPETKSEGWCDDREKQN